ncbi:unnamed protein product [Parascedosporium putredinis]|uniref:Uncharacterized protein n=1 Tax=Parascedosporium putredinis TaxID=1442378 RepID=A0A9P1MEC5_9PEZI|nr:unnamed protein product [Parascedosporium putredinis]CAI8002360.1 unnamed protein product [Parascedosporium putredinis]
MVQEGGEWARIPSVQSIQTLNSVPFPSTPNQSQSSVAQGRVQVDESNTSVAPGLGIRNYLDLHPIRTGTGPPTGQIQVMSFPDVGQRHLLPSALGSARARLQVECLPCPRATEYCLENYQWLVKALTGFN